MLPPHQKVWAIGQHRWPPRKLPVFERDFSLFIDAWGVGLNHQRAGLRKPTKIARKPR